MRLEGRHILLGVTGGIAAYKSAALVRLLVRAGADVRVVMTPMAQEFVAPLTFATLSQHPIYVEMFDPTSGTWNSHVDLGRWANLFLIAPATANTLAKIRAGIADNLLLTTALSVRCPIMVAPAMDLDMYAHSTTQDNLRALQSQGVRVVEPTAGFLASGLEGKGRMAEPESILDSVLSFFSSQESTSGSWTGKRVLLTMGPTREPIDPVRFLSNQSTGRMGSAIADYLHRQGAHVECVSGPAQFYPSSPVTLHKVERAQEMFEQCQKLWPSMDVAILSAAVADYRPAQESESKIKREKESLTLELRANPDIAKSLGESKRDGQLVVGFALETDNGLANARAKMQRKHLDMCVLNSLADPGAGFGGQTNVATLLFADGTEEKRQLERKEELAKAIADALIKRLCSHANC